MKANTIDYFAIKLALWSAGGAGAGGGNVGENTHRGPRINEMTITKAATQPTSIKVDVALFLCWHSHDREIISSVGFWELTY